MKSLNYGELLLILSNQIAGEMEYFYRRDITRNNKLSTLTISE